MIVKVVRGDVNEAAQAVNVVTLLKMSMPEPMPRSSARVVHVCTRVPVKTQSTVLQSMAIYIANIKQNRKIHNKIRSDVSTSEAASKAYLRNFCKSRNEYFINRLW